MHRLLRRAVGAFLGFCQSPWTPAAKVEAIITLERFLVQDRIIDPILATGTDHTFQLKVSASFQARCLPRLEHGINPCRPLFTNP
jgi:hypothetical protein